MYTTPLRYPGGKSVFTPFLVSLLRINGLENCIYAEPYAGGAGAATNLLLSGNVKRILINDANLGIYAFWKAITEENDRFCDWVMNKPVDLRAWKDWHRIFLSTKSPSFDLGFDTFFLTRTNRSGILNAGPIGGNSEDKQEKAKYKIDCRFNREALCSRIHSIGEHRQDIIVSNKDAIDFLKEQDSDSDIFVYLDPPYYEQGKSLYMSYYKPENHKILANYLEHNASFKWVLSYDCVDVIKEYYRQFDVFDYSINYSARTARIGRELLAHSPGLILPKDTEIIKYRSHRQK